MVDLGIEPKDRSDGHRTYTDSITNSLITHYSFMIDSFHGRPYDSETWWKHRAPSHNYRATSWVQFNLNRSKLISNSTVWRHLSSTSVQRQGLPLRNSWVGPALTRAFSECSWLISKTLLRVCDEMNLQEVYRSCYPVSYYFCR